MNKKTAGRIPVAFFECLRRHHALLLQPKLPLSYVATVHQLGVSKNLVRRIRNFIAANADLVRAAAATNNWAAVEATIFQKHSAYRSHLPYKRMVKRLGALATPSADAAACVAATPSSPPTHSASPSIGAAPTPAPAHSPSTEQLVRHIQLGAVGLRCLTPAALAAIGHAPAPAASIDAASATTDPQAGGQDTDHHANAHALARQIALGEWIERHLTADGLAALQRGR